MKISSISMIFQGYRDFSVKSCDCAGCIAFSEFSATPRALDTHTEIDKLLSLLLQSHHSSILFIILIKLRIYYCNLLGLMHSIHSEVKT